MGEMNKKKNSAQRNFEKQQIRLLEDQAAAELGKMVGWTLFGILFLPTLIAPYIAYGYGKKSIERRKEIKEKITAMQLLQKGH